MMTKHISAVFLYCFLFFSGPLFSQVNRRATGAVNSAKSVVLNKKELSPYSIGFRGGLTQFFGELKSQDMKGMLALSLTRAYGKRFAIGLDYTIGKVAGEKVDFFNSYFSTRYNTIELLGKWNLTEQFSKRKRNKFDVSVYGGLGLMLFNAKAYDINTNKLIRFSNSDESVRNPLFLRWGTPKGAKGIKNTNERIIPVGATLDYKLNNQWKLGVDYRFYMVRTDKLDATSGMRLLNPEEGTSYSDTPNDKFGVLSFSIKHTFTRAVRDRDGDGITDDRDRCPEAAGVTKFYGCPDSDSDGIPDYVDRCPSEPGNPAGRGCPDADGDGFINKVDECPNAAGTVRGCPDSDEDGIIDTKDACPNVKGEGRFAGCPDSDRDGISDALDLCPSISGTYANKGCPDTDGDGVNDAEDRCMNDPGDPANFGCPLITNYNKQTLQKQIDEILAKPIAFGYDTDEIQNSSFGQLNEVVLILARNRNITVLVEGYTDDAGSAVDNQTLSEKRAMAVEKYLTERGVPAERIFSIGYGETRPIDPGNTPQARVKNRRVAIKINE